MGWDGGGAGERKRSVKSANAGREEGELKQFCGLAFVKVVVVVVAVSLVVINEAETGPQAKRDRERESCLESEREGERKETLLTVIRRSR